jgi:hypothetical protein
MGLVVVRRRRRRCGCVGSHRILSIDREEESFLQSAHSFSLDLVISLTLAFKLFDPCEKKKIIKVLEDTTYYYNNDDAIEVHDDDVCTTYVAV